MDARCARFLCKAADGIFHVVRCDHHEVGKLINNDDDGGHFLFGFCRIEAFHIAYAGLGKFGIALFHLLHRPIQDGGRLFCVRDNGNHQMWYAIVVGKLNHLGIYEDELHFIRPRFEENARDERVDADRFA